MHRSMLDRNCSTPNATEQSVKFNVMQRRYICRMLKHLIVELSLQESRRPLIREMIDRSLDQSNTLMRRGP